jgi:hypothetical protein
MYASAWRRGLAPCDLTAMLGILGLSETTGCASIYHRQKNWRKGLFRASVVDSCSSRAPWNFLVCRRYASLRLSAAGKRPAGHLFPNSLPTLHTYLRSICSRAIEEMAAAPETSDRVTADDTGDVLIKRRIPRSSSKWRIMPPPCIEDKPHL